MQGLIAYLLMRISGLDYGHSIPDKVLIYSLHDNIVFKSAPLSDKG